MAHRYQSRFSYRPLGEYMLGEYLRPTGFGTYTLGSLSNRPGKDWATPRYVRDEPDRFMSGFGVELPEGWTSGSSADIPEGWTDNGDGSMTNEDDETTYIPGGPADPTVNEPMGPPSDLQEPLTEEEKARGVAIAEKEKPFWETEAGKFLASTGKTVGEIGLKIGVPLALNAAGKLINSVTGQPVPSSLTRQSAPSSLPPPTSTQPIPIVPIPVTEVRALSSLQAGLRSGTIRFSPKFYAERGIPMPALPGQVASKTTPLLIIGAAVVAFLVLSKK